VHRSSIGAIERIFAFLIEHYKGAFPTWLAPIQAVVIPIAQRHLESSTALATDLKEAGHRVDIDVRNEPLGAKIRHHTLQKVPFLGIIGDQEIASQTISVRSRFSKAVKSMTLHEFKDLLATED
jgi:threonyl-tRNA synthetase